LPEHRIKRHLLRDVTFARVSIPRLDQAPTLQDFEGMQPASPLAKQVLLVNKFIGRIPVDPCAKTPIWMGTKDTFFGVEWGDWLNQRLPGSRGVRRLEDANLFFPEEMPNIIAKEAINLWHIHG
jgi:hypothetical protein